MQTYDITQTVQIFTMISAPSEEEALRLFKCPVAALGDGSSLQNIITDLDIGMRLDHASILTDSEHEPVIYEVG